MNLPLHFGMTGALEAGLIALFVGFAVYAGWSWVCRRAGMTVGHAIGGGAAIAVALAAGIDAWNLFYLGIARLESPLYARLALAGIHDPDNLGVRVMLEVIGALCGTVFGWWWFSGRHAEAASENAIPGTGQHDDTAG